VSYPHSLEERQERRLEGWQHWRISRQINPAIGPQEIGTMGKLLRMTRRLLASATILYCAGLLILALLWETGIQGYRWLDLANIFALLLFAPLLFLAPAAFLSGSPRAQLAVVIACTIFLWVFGPRLLPRNMQASGGARLRVATFNLHSNRAERQVVEIITAIRARPADVYLLQELSEPVATAIREQLARDYPYQALVPASAATGMGMISRHPLDMPPRQTAPIQTAQLRVGDSSITLINVSLTGPEIKWRRVRGVGRLPRIGSYDTGKRDGEVIQLLRAVDDAHGPLIVAGDFNLSDREPNYRQLAGRLLDAYAETRSDFGFTYPSRLRLKQLTIPAPLIRIDYVWSTGGVIPAAAETSCGIASDHCLVSAELKLSGS
jgi:endonuclease/exonuclease/phosphatase (EEP) superfamily protein YafD